MSEKHLTDQKFTDLNLVESLKNGVHDAGFEFCTPIQARSLPVVLEGGDVAGQAQTGTGKTVAFLLGCCQYLLNRPPAPDRKTGSIRALILAPTRELAIQIHEDARVLAAHTGLRIGLIYGGTGYDEQKKILGEDMDILIGTPGRLIDFYRQKLFDLGRVEVVVLDEADRMFDLGFIKDIRYLLRKMPRAENRLNMLFSATLSYRVMELAYEHMNNPEEIKINADVRVAAKIEEHAYYPAVEEKPRLLINLLRRDRPERALVFVNTRYAVDEVAGILSANGVSSAALSGDVPQNKRERLLEGFKAGKYNTLVATDVAARGLHIPQVDQVFNYDLPQDSEDYVHRIGRTARAGQSGEAISFVCEKYAYSIMEIEDYIGHEIPRGEIGAELLADIESAPRRPPRPGRPGREKGRGRRDGAGKPSGRDARGGRRERPPRPEAAPVAVVENAPGGEPEMTPQPWADTGPAGDAAATQTPPADPEPDPRERFAWQEGGFTYTPPADESGGGPESGTDGQERLEESAPTAAQAGDNGGETQPEPRPRDNAEPAAVTAHEPETRTRRRKRAGESAPADVTADAPGNGGETQPETRPRDDARATPRRFSKKFGETPLVG